MLRTLNKSWAPLFTNSSLKPAFQTRYYPGGKGELKKIGGRKKSAEIIAKITNTMKLVASVKFKAAQQKAEETAPFFTSLQKVFDEHAFTSTKEQKQQKVLSILVTTDKGLCGPINSNLLRTVRKLSDSKRTTVILVGEKAASGIFNIGLAPRVTFSSHFLKGDTNFIQLGAIAEKAISMDFDVCKIWYNKFVSAIEFAVTAIEVPSLATLSEPQNKSKLYRYEINEPLPQVLTDLTEFYIAAALNYTYYQTAASEMASRQNSMDSATKNAKELIKKLRIRYNKIRQGVITTELTEITSGASVIKGKEA
eukprot:TRINITY_DN408_c0_g1_i1.p1 TRINITY_DN408_c0_g1~~TRINITY_DN408_c0_g1_i1.p1  ORF type:complete len:309 (+),score=61.82 TRINITY_DN408_c0_g1_i1:102-1028(+)